MFGRRELSLGPQLLVLSYTTSWLKIEVKLAQRDLAFKLREVQTCPSAFKCSR